MGNGTYAGRHDNSHLWDPQCEETHEGSLQPYTSELLPPCLAWLNRIGWCVVAWIPLIPLIHLLHLKLWRKNCCYLLVIPSLNLRHRKSFVLHPKPLMCVLIEFLNYIPELQSFVLVDISIVLCDILLYSVLKKHP